MIARSSLCASIASCKARNNFARSPAVRRDHAGSASAAASIARRVSAAPMSGTSPSSAPVAGLCTSTRLPLSASHQAAPIRGGEGFLVDVLFPGAQHLLVALTEDVRLMLGKQVVVGNPDQFLAGPADGL